MPLFKDRRDAGRQLAQQLLVYADRPDVIVLALPRGGVPVAYEVALALRVPLDIFLVRKLGVPGHEELALGAIASGGVQVLNDEIVQTLRIPGEVIHAAAQRELQELERRERVYRGNRPHPEFRDCVVILIDDGLATGASMRAAVKAIRIHHPARIVIGVPTAAPKTCEEFEHAVNEIICAMTPEPFYGVGRWYEDFSQTSDEEVRTYLAETARHRQHKQDTGMSTSSP